VNQNIKIESVHTTLDAKTKKYIEACVARLLKFIPRKDRKAATFNVKIVQQSSKEQSNIQAQIILDLPGKQLVAKSYADGILGGADEVSEKMRGVLRRYKTELLKERENHGFLKRIARRK